MALTLNIDYTDIEARLKHFTSGLSDISDEIDDIVELHTAAVEVVVLSIGVDASTVSATSHRLLYIVCRFIVIMRTTAELLISYSHEYGDAADIRRQQANKLEWRIEESPETFIDDWNEHDFIGSFGYADVSENITSGGLKSFGIDWQIARGF